MTLGPAGAARALVRGCLVQALVLVSINVPTVSFGLAMGWVSLASGGGAEGAGGWGELVGAAGATFVAGLAGVPLAARALHRARRPALAATSAAFAACWAPTLAGGWCLVAGRLCAGVAGTLAWTLAPVLGKEMVSARAGGAAAAAPVLAHNLGMLLMYLAAYARLSHSAVVGGCLALSVLHCGASLLAPESPPYLAAQGRHEEARAALAWLRGVERDHPALADELRAMPPPGGAPPALLRLARDMLSDEGRRRAFLVALVAVVGQEACGVLTVLQFAERVFQLAGGEGPGAGREGEAAQYALLLGGVQLVTSAAALYLLERVGRRPLVVWCACGAGAALALAAACARAGHGAGWVAAALAAAVAADSLGLQPAPYAILADMFHYQYRGCAVVLVTAAGNVGNAAETLVFPALAAAAGLWAALALAALLTLLYALFALLCVPETRARAPEDIYRELCPRAPPGGAAAAAARAPRRHGAGRNGVRIVVTTPSGADDPDTNTSGNTDYKIHNIDKSDLCTSENSGIAVLTHKDTSTRNEVCIAVGGAVDPALAHTDDEADAATLDKVEADFRTSRNSCCDERGEDRSRERSCVDNYRSLDEGRRSNVDNYASFNEKTNTKGDISRETRSERHSSGGGEGLADRARDTARSSSVLSPETRCTSL